MSTHSGVKIDLRKQSDVVAARQSGRRIANDLGFRSADQTRLATAISELARNAIQYAGEGVCYITDESNQHTAKVQVVIEDFGPGIPDIEKAMTLGFSTSDGLGAGLQGAKRLVHEFAIETEPGHTRVTIAVSRPKE